MIDIIALTPTWLNDEEAGNTLATMAEARERFDQFAAEGNPQDEMQVFAELIRAKGNKNRRVHIWFETDGDDMHCGSVLAPQEAGRLFPGAHGLDSYPNRIRSWFSDVVVRFIPGAVKNRALRDQFGVWLGEQVGMAATLHEPRSNRSLLGWNLSVPMFPTEGTDKVTGITAVPPSWVHPIFERGSHRGLTEIRERFARYAAEGNPQDPLRISVELTSSEDDDYTEAFVEFTTVVGPDLEHGCVLMPIEARHLLHGDGWHLSHPDRLRSRLSDLAVRLIPGAVKNRMLRDQFGVWIGEQVGMAATFNDARSSRTSLSWDLTLPTS